MPPLLHSLLRPVCALLFLIGVLSGSLLAVTVSYVGGNSFTAAELESAISEELHAINESGLAPAMADDAAFTLTLWYHKRGYSQAEVTWQIGGPERLILSIKEGPLTKLADISFPGAKSITSGTLRSYVVAETQKRYPGLKSEAELPYVESDVKASVAVIRGLYQSEGFLDVVVSDPIIRFSKGYTQAGVTIPISEGIQYRFGKISVEGDVMFLSTDDPLLKSLEPFTSKPYTPSAVAQMERQVIYFYKVRGYYNAKVETHSDPAEQVNGLVPVHFRVDSGDVYRFNGVEVKGLERLSEQFIRNRFKKLNGKFYNPEKLDELFRELMRTSLFTRLNIETEALPNRTILLHVNVQEARAKELGFSIGFGTFEGPIIGVSAADRNLFGSGRPITANIETSSVYLRADVTYLDPWFLESDYSLRLRLFGVTVDYDGYTQNELGFRGDLTKKINKNWEAGMFLQARQVHIKTTGIDPAVIGPGNSLVNSIGVSQTLDFRDSILNPHQGFIFSTTAEFAADVLGGGVEFGRISARFSYYQPFGKTLLAFGVRGGVMVPFGGNNIPISERYFNGGSRSVRSYAERELGPKDRNGYPIGGNTFSVFNIEYEIPITETVAGAFFVDAGTVGNDWSDFPGEFRTGIGAGVRYRLPVGPIRLDAAVNPAPGRDDTWGAIHFSFGFAF